jgi:2-keto-3-deoxy-L-rhamnonate aldolase RhmA
VPDIGSSTILRYLDRGIMGILGPHIAAEANARQLVRACFFGPLGERSLFAHSGSQRNGQSLAYWAFLVSFPEKID